MSDPLLDQIERLFLGSDRDEFVALPREAPYCVVPPPAKESPVLYSTRPLLILTCLDRLGISPFAEIGLVGRYGLPQPGDVAWLGGLLDRRVVGFLGDMDGVDLMIFAWLRRRFPASRVIYLGIGDELLSAAKIEISETSPLSIEVSEEEWQQHDLVRSLLPDLASLLGPMSSQAMARGRKFELPAVFTQAVAIGDEWEREIDRWRDLLR